MTHQLLIDTLVKIGSSATQVDHIQEVCASILSPIRTFFSADTASIYLMNPANGNGLDEVTLGEDEQLTTYHHNEQPSLNNIAHILNVESGLLAVESLAENPRYTNEIVQAQGIQAFFAMIVYQPFSTKPFGVLFLNYRHKRRFDDAFKRDILYFRHQISLVVDRLWFRYRYELVTQVSKQINERIDDEETIYNTLKQNIGNIVDASDFWMLVVHSPETNILRMFVHENGEDYQSEAPLSGISEWILNERQLLSVSYFSRQSDLLPTRPVDIPNPNRKPQYRESLIYVPLVVREISFGVLSVQNKRPEVYNRDDEHLIELLGNQIASALSNIRLFANLKRLNEMGQFINANQGKPDTLKRVLTKIMEYTFCDLVYLYPYDEVSRTFETPIKVGDLLSVTPIFPINLMQQHDMVALATNLAEPVFSKDAQHIYEAVGGKPEMRYAGLVNHGGYFEQREQIKSVAVLSLVIENQKLGALFLNFRKTRQRFDAPQKLLIEGLGTYCALSIRNQRQTQSESNKHIQELQSLKRIDDIISQGQLDLTNVLDIILNLAKERIPAMDWGAIILNQRLEYLEVASVIGDPMQERLRNVIEEADQSLVYWVFENKRDVFCGNIRTNAIWAGKHEPLIPSSISVIVLPLIDAEDNVVAVLACESRSQNAFSSDDKHFLVTLTGQAVVAIKNAQEHERQLFLKNAFRKIGELSQRFINFELEEDKIWRDLLDTTITLSEADAGHIMLYDSRDNRLRLSQRIHNSAYLAHEDDSEQEVVQPLDMDAGVAAQAAVTGKIVNVPDTRKQANYMGDVPNMSSELAIPLKRGQDLKGVINVESSRPRNFDLIFNAQIPTMLADLGYIALTNFDLLKSLNLQMWKDATFVGISKTVTEVVMNEVSPDALFDEGYRLVVELVTQLNDKQNCAIYRLILDDDDEPILSLVYASKDSSDYISPSRTIRLEDNDLVAHAAKTRLTQREQRPRYAHYNPLPQQKQFGAHVAIPIQSKTELFGVLVVAHPEPEHFSGDVKVLENLAEQLAIAHERIANKQKVEDLQEEFEAAKPMREFALRAGSLPHSLAEDLGLISVYIEDIEQELEDAQVDSNVFERVKTYLDKIAGDTQDVLKLAETIMLSLRDHMEEDEEKSIIALRDEIPNFEKYVARVKRRKKLLINFDTSQVPDDLHALHVPPRQFEEAIKVLLQNAIDAVEDNPEGEIKLYAYNYGLRVVICVEDNGRGMSPDVKSRIFNFAFTTKTDRDYPNSGYGLWSTKLFILEQNGDIRVRSELDKGTTFFVRLPGVTR